MDRFLEMETFAALVELGSFVRVAADMHTSKAAVSRHLGSLEARLGVRLLQRTTRKLSATQEGEVFYQRCKSVLTLLEEADSEASSNSADVVGLLRINAPVSFGILQLANCWAKFHVKYPKLKLEIDLSDRVINVVEESYDLAIRIARLESSSLVSKKLASTRMMLCASPTYLKERGAPERPADLANHALIAYSYWSTKDEWQFEGPLGTESVRANPFVRSNNGDTCLAVALAHQGIILQPSFIVSDALRAGTLVECMPGYRSYELGIHAIYPTRKFLAPKVRALIDFLVEYFAEHDVAQRDSP